MKGDAFNSCVRTIDTNQNCPGQIQHLVILMNITADAAEVTEEKMGGNRFNEEGQMQVAYLKAAPTLLPPPQPASLCYQPISIFSLRAALLPATLS